MTKNLSPEGTLRRHGPIVLLCTGIFGLIGWVSMKIFLGYPLCMDEYNYLYQAKIFATGHRFLTIPESYEPLAEMYMVAAGPRLFSKYAPLWSMLLSVGERMSLSALVNPFLSAVTVFFVYRAARLTASPRNSLLAALLLGTNGYFIGYGASFFAQPLSLTLAAAAFYFYREYEASPGPRPVVAIGALAGAAVFSRPADAFCLAAAIAVGIVLGPGGSVRRLKAVALMGAVSLVGVAGLLLYNHALTGHWAITTYTLDNEQLSFIGAPDQAPSGVLDLAATYLRELRLSALRNFFTTLLRAGAAFPVLVLVGLVAAARGFRRVALLHVGFLVALYNFHAGLGWPQYGARYWYPGLAGVAVVVADGLDWIERRSNPRVALELSVIAIFLQILSLGGILQVDQRRFDVAMTTQADIFRMYPRPAIVALLYPAPTSLWWKNADPYVKWADFRRNIFVKGPHYYTWFGNLQNGEVRRLFPNLPYRIYRFDAYDRLAGRPLPPLDPEVSALESK